MLSIRSAREREIPLLLDIECSAGEKFRQWPGLEWVADDAVQTAEQHRHILANGFVLVADLESCGIVAFANGEVMADALHIWQIAVRFDLQGRGIGRRLIETVVQMAAAQGLTAVTLTTFRQVPWNEPFYRRLGFTTLECLELTPHLKAVLAAEERAGLPLAQRCAMRRLI